MAFPDTSDARLVGARAHVPRSRSGGDPGGGRACAVPPERQLVRVRSELADRDQGLGHHCGWGSRSWPGAEPMERYGWRLARVRISGRTWPLPRSNAERWCARGGTVNLSSPRAIFAGSPPRFTRSGVTYEAYAVSRTSTRPQVDSALQGANVDLVPACGELAQQRAEWEQMTDRRRGVRQHYRHRLLVRDRRTDQSSPSAATNRSMALNEMPSCPYERHCGDVHELRQDPGAGCPSQR